MTNSRKIIIKNIFSLSLASVLTRVLSAFAGIILVRYFTTNDYGAYQSAIAYVAMFGVISDLGIGQLLVRDGARDKGDFEKITNNALVIEIILSIITMAIMVICMLFTSYSKLTWLFIIIISVGQLIIDSTFTPIFTAVFQAKDKLDISSYISILSSLFSAALILLFAFLRLNSTMFVLIFPLTSLIFLFVRMFLIRKDYKLRFVLNLKIIKYVIKESIPYGVSSVTSYIYLQSGTFILSLIMLEKATGTFSAAFKLILIAYTIPQVIYTGFMKKMFGHSSTEYEVFDRYYNSLFRVLLPIGIFITFNFYFFGGNIIMFLYKSKYMDSISIFKYLSILVTLEFINYPPSSLLLFINEQKVKSAIQTFIAVLNIILNIVFIKTFGIMGVVYAIITTDTIKNFIWYIAAYKYGYRISWDKKYLLIPLALCIVAAFYVLLSNKVNFIILGCLGTVVYSIIIFKFGYIKLRTNKK